MSCCPDNSESPRAAAVHESSLVQVGETTIYRAGPATARVGILAFPDIFGLDSGRAKQDADALGALGYAGAFVDLMGGEYATDGWDMVERIASYGYCWGAWVGARLSAEATPVIQGHVSFHPSWIVENMLNGDGQIEALAARVQVPQLLLSAENDPESLKEGGSVEKILVARNDPSRAVDFPYVKHGWVNRGDVADPTTKANVDKAWRLAREFLQTVTA